LQGFEESRETQQISAQPAITRNVEYQISKEERGIASRDTRVEMWRNILQQLMAVDIANLTPLQALNLLNEMQVKVNESRGHVVG
jgi:hypothetical protein